jgi:hypothetical protein
LITAVSRVRLNRFDEWTVEAGELWAPSIFFDISILSQTANELQMGIRNGTFIMMVPCVLNIVETC